MEKLELTATEVMATLNWNKSKVYYWVNSGKFETVQRETGINILLSEDDIRRLKNNKISNSSNISENDVKMSEIVQENSVENVTKNYETVSNSQIQFYNDALLTVKEMYQTLVQSQSYSMKLLTDGKSEIEQEYFELKANNLTLSQKVEQSTKSNNLKNIVIVALTTLLIISVIGVGILSNCLVKFQTVGDISNVEQVKTVQENTKQVTQPVKPVQRKK